MWARGAASKRYGTGVGLVSVIMTSSKEGPETSVFLACVASFRERDGRILLHSHDEKKGQPSCRAGVRLPGERRALCSPNGLGAVEISPAVRPKTGLFFPPE